MGEVHATHPFTRALNKLINGMHPPVGKDGRAQQITHRALAADIHRATGARLSANYLWKLRTGQAVNPSYETLEVFRGYFGLDSLDPFTDPQLAAARGSELALINALRGNVEQEVLELVLRDGLRQGTVRADSVLAMLDVLRRIENEQSQ
ncbi:hypothetical protein IU486_25495 [Streptomyces gardneri]|uniref:hypothetical protein n=1 Tax=Nocardia sputi TaxID=2943705 RepID=UPI0018930A6B|nr:hypothetical protein [Nocardia sputi]MBF6168079.1 hypothetical protein [Streptomyces gardneri]MBF6206858.1 hypothetical protein [Streptomyces gardneri]